MFSAAYVSASMEEVRNRIEEGLALLRSAQEIAPSVSATAEATRHNVERRLLGGVVTAAVIGEVGLRHALFDRLLSAEVFGRHGTEPPGTIRRLVPGRDLDYVAFFRDGAIERFSERFADRHAALTEALARSERDREEAARELQEHEAALQASADRDRPTPSAARSSGGWWRRVWAWVLALFARMLGRAPSPALPAMAEATPAPLVTTSVVATAREQLEAITADCERLRVERDSSSAERREAFWRELRTLADPADRGAGVADLRIETPPGALAPDVVLLDLPDLGRDDEAGARANDVMIDEADGCIVLVSPGEEPPAFIEDYLGALRPHVLTEAPSAVALRAVCERVRDERPIMLAARTLAAAQQCAAQATERANQVEAAYREKMAELEAHRVTDPEEFRAHFLTRMERAIGDSIDEVLANALRRVGDQIGAVKTGWKTAIEAAGSRAAIDEQVKAINESATARLTAVVTNVSDQLTNELQTASDTMQLWIREEMHSRTELVHRHWPTEESSPVMSAVTPDDFALLQAPLANAIIDFEHRRVGYGVGGAAAGALLGTLVVPGIGTAIGAFMGTFAGFLERTDSLKTKCIAKLDACLDDSEAQVRAELESRRAELAAAVRASLDDALQVALDRFDQQLNRLLALERKVLLDEQARRDKLAVLTTAIEAHAGRLAEIADSVREHART